MEKDEYFFTSTEGGAPLWNSCSFGTDELNCGQDQLPYCFLNPNWDNPLDQNDPFESALSSIVSSPVGSSANAVPNAGVIGGDNIMIRELIGRLENICNSGDVSPQSYINNSTNTSCYSTPLNSPPKLNLSVMDSQIRGNLLVLGNSLVNHPSFAPFPADPGFAKRAARYSCFGSRNLEGGLNLNGQSGLNESELDNTFVPLGEPGKLLRVSSKHSMKVAGSQPNTQDSNRCTPQCGNLISDKKFSWFSRSSTLDKADSREESSVCEQIPCGELSMKSQNARKRKSIPRGKAKETSSSSPSAASDADGKVESENHESRAKKSKSDGGVKDAAKGKEEEEEEEEEENGKQKQNSKAPEAPKDYIHVRARRGQATDSHSLAERVRREKISERMKFLQDLVPGCNKVTGKAVMLDEIINYVQSLQRQVEFLSMKLATVNPRIDFDMELSTPSRSKDMFQSGGGGFMSHPLDSFPYDYFQSQQQQQQGLADLQKKGVSYNTETHSSTNPSQVVYQRNPSMQLPNPLLGFVHPIPIPIPIHQASATWEDDLQSVVQMGYGQNQQQSFPSRVRALN